ncbi:MAG: tRNA dimethylallyltransferase 2 [Candidatus Parcubacteria bacterium]|nr:MAG: tRNA dimethylallyltransferase 2 [Candidatus Parcubacteria bacterium]
MDNKQNIIFITGLTASGKSDLALWLANKINGEIINADSRQVYKYLDIGSGKIEIKRLKEIKIKSKKFIVSYSKKFNIPHYLISQQHPKYNYSLGKWLNDVDILIDYLNKKNKKIIICGGTILYLKAIKEGWRLPEVTPNYKLRNMLNKLSTKELYDYLYNLDRNRAQNIDRFNRKRLVRAIEIAKSIGIIPPLLKIPKYRILILAPNFNWLNLERKIRQRLKLRSFGIIKEIIKLRKISLSFERIISFGLEYRWFGLLIKNLNISKISLNYFKKLIKSNFYENIFESCYRDIKKFAKKQFRELKKINDVIWVDKRKNCLQILNNYFN